MEFYFEKVNTSLEKKIVADDMLLTKELPTTAGSKMLEGYVSLFEAEALTRLTEAGYGLCGKAAVGEFAIDLLGETSYKGACTDENGKILNPVAEIIKSGDAMAGICLDANGYVRRAAAQYGLVSVKPTYGTVSQGIQNRIRRDYGRASKSAKLRYVMRRVFPKAEFYKSYCPVAYKYKILIPPVWFYRLVRALFVRRGRIKQEIEVVSRMDEK